MRYKIDRKHPFISSLLSESGDKKDVLRATLDLIETSVPVEKIWMSMKDQESEPVSAEVSEEDLERIEAYVTMMFKQLKIGDREALDQMREILMGSEPFCDHGEIVDRIYRHRLGN